MEVTKKNPTIAIGFGVLAIATAVVLVSTAPRLLELLLAAFWLVTGLLAGFVAIKSRNQ